MPLPAAQKAAAVVKANVEPARPAEQLSEFEVQLLQESRGLYQPLEMREKRRPHEPAHHRHEAPQAPQGSPGANGKLPARKCFREHSGVRFKADGSEEPCGRVSVVCPTMDSRGDFHKRLHACFKAQEWPDKELVVVETHRSQPSAFFTHQAAIDLKIVFVSIQIPGEDKDLSIGLKRNIGLHLASGEWVACFDDDDLYAPSYLPEMLGEMVRNHSLAITLGAWYVFEERHGVLGYVDPRGMDGFRETVRLTWGGSVKQVEAKDRDEWLYGYGFSYVYSREYALKWPYADMDMGEDFDFFMRLKHRVPSALLFDDYGICVHTLHTRSTSSCQAKQVNREDLADLDVAGLGDLLLEYVSHAPPLPIRSHNFSCSEWKNRAVTITTSQGTFEVQRPVGCTALDAKRLLAPQVGVSPADFGLFAESPQEGDEPLADHAPVTLRMRQLWAVLPIDLSGPEEVEVLCTDATDPEFTLTVRVLSSARMGDLRAALLEQHCAAARKELSRRLRLARRVNSHFVGVDEKTPLGDVRALFVMGLVDAIRS